MSNPRLYSTHELATTKNVSLASINRQIALGKLKATRVSHVWVVFEHDAQEWLATYAPQSQR